MNIQGAILYNIPMTKQYIFINAWIIPLEPAHGEKSLAVITAGSLVTIFKIHNFTNKINRYRKSIP